MIRLSLTLLASLPSGLSITHEDPERLARALDAIVETTLRSDLYFLADDVMGGRDTPSPQLTASAKFLASRLQRLGFSSAKPSPTGAANDWYHQYPLHKRSMDLQASSIALHSKRGSASLACNEDYFLYRGTHAYASEVEAPIVSAGAGSGEDLEAGELKGHWALVFEQGGSILRMQRKCQEAGAVGLILAETDGSKHDYREKYQKYAARAANGATTLHPMERSESKQDEIPIVMLSREGLLKLLEADGLEGDNLVVPAGQALQQTLKETRIVTQSELPVPNVAGFWPGRDPELSKEVIIVSAHFDHVGITGDQIFNGADDNASGSSGLLGIAEGLHAYGPMRRSVLLLWLSGEEKGLWGSEAWTQNPELPEGCRPVANLNIDMIGRTDPDELYVTPTAGHPSFNAISEAAYAMAKLEGFPKLKGQDEFWERSDHYNFDQNLGIPVAFLSSGQHPDYHKHTDTPEKIDYEKLARITRTIMRLLDHIEDGVLN